MGGELAAYRPEAVHFQFPLSALSRTRWCESCSLVHILSTPKKPGWKTDRWIMDHNLTSITQEMLFGSSA